MRVATSQKVSPRWLRVKEAEAYAGLGRTTLTELVKAGEIEAAKVGKSLRIDRLSIDKFMQQRIAGGVED